MTTQTKKFVEISDIVALLFECKNPECGISLSLPVRHGSNGIGGVQSCPHCGAHWATLPHGDYSLEFKHLLDILDKLSNAPIGCSFSLEIRPERTEPRG